MPKLEDWLSKAKNTKLRTWLNLKEIDKLIEADKPVVWLMAQTSTGIQCLSARIDGIAKRYSSTSSTGETALSDLLLDCFMIMEDGTERAVQLKASLFIPDSNSEMNNLSRMFEHEIHRDHFVEDVLFCSDVFEEATAELYKRNAHMFFRRILGGGNPNASA